MCFVFIWEQTATCATYSINRLVFYNRDEKCLLRGTNWIFKYSSLRFAFKRVNIATSFQPYAQNSTANCFLEIWFREMSLQFITFLLCYTQTCTHFWTHPEQNSFDVYRREKMIRMVGAERKTGNETKIVTTRRVSVTTTDMEMQ